MKSRDRLIFLQTNLLWMRLLLVLILLPVLFSSCFDEVGDGKIGPSPTLLVYMGGDNSLRGEVQQKINALAAAWTEPRGHLLVYRDAGGVTNPCLIEIVRTENGSHRIDTLQRYTERNSASASAFRAAVCDAYVAYSASRFGLLVFSHGSGWIPEGLFVQPRSAMQSPSKVQSPSKAESPSKIESRSAVQDGSSELDLRDFAEALPDGLCQYIIFESCLMAGLEVAYELKEKTDYVVASAAEIVSPGFTPIYSTLLPLLFRQQLDLTKVAATYYEHGNARTGDSQSATVSVICTAELEPLKNIVHAAEIGVADWSAIQRNQVQHFDRGNDEHLFYDLGGYLNQITTPAEKASLEQALNKAVIYKAATASFMPNANGFEIKQHSGLTLYIPDPHYPELNDARLKLKLFQ